MIIGIDASRANNAQKTGVEWYAFQVIEELKKIIPASHQVRLYTREPLQGSLGLLPAHWQERVLKWRPRRLWTQLRLSWEMWRQGPDILFVPAHVLPWIHPQKIFITIHDLGGIRFPQGFSWFERWYNKFSIRRALTKAAKVVTVSEFCRREILAFFPKAQPNQIKVIYNGFDKDHYRPNYKDALCNTKGIFVTNAREPYFITISRLEEKKNTLGLMEAFQLFLKQNPESRHKLVLIGKPGLGFKLIVKEIDRSPFKDRFILPGWLETVDTARLLSHAEALVFPSFYEGFGIPVLEAMASGVPVIASYSGALPEICGSAAILVNPNKPGEIAAAMKQVQDQTLRRLLIEAGLKRAAQFSWQSCAQELWQILSQHERSF